MSLSNDLGLLVLRLSVGALMLTHGWPKYSGFATKAETFADPIGFGPKTSLALAIGAELGCSLLLIVGLFTRFAAVPLAFTMGVAAFVVHANDPFAKQEFALLYMAAYVTLLFAGAGRFSIDGLRARNRSAGWAR